MKKIILILMVSLRLEGFDLRTVQSYAQNTTEYPSPDFKNPAFNPDYTNWYLNQGPSLWSRFLESVGVKKKPWPFDSFKQHIATKVKEREAAGYQFPHALIVKPYKESEFIIIGPLFGSFHSLVRMLTELWQQGYITAQLKLKNRQQYLIFNGNVIDGSPYILETLTLVLELMEANPQRVFYIKGEHENDDFWKGYGLRQELSLRMDGLFLENSVSRFFKTLPQELFIVSPTSEKSIIKIASLPYQLEKAGETSCLPYIKRLSQGDIVSCPLNKKRGEFPLKAIISGEKRVMSYRQHPGLSLLPAEQGVLTWTIFSSPNTLYRDYFHFFYDAFVILKIGNSLTESVLVLFNQDVREQIGFKKAALYEVFTGKRIEPVIASARNNSDLDECRQKKDLSYVTKQAKSDDSEPLTIGCTLDLSKGASVPSKHVKEGLSLYVNQVNLHGGINGRPLNVVFMDDEYSPEKARKNVEYFIKTFKSTLFLCCLGSPTLQAYIDLVKENKIFMFFPVTGAPLFRKPDLLSIVHWRASYKSEAEMLTRYMIKNYQITNFAFLYQNDSYGHGALEGSRKVLKEAGIKKYFEVSYERNTTSFKAQIEKLKSESVEALGFFSTSLGATEFIRQIGVDYFIGKKLFALSDLAEESFKKFAEQKGLDITIAQFSPNPSTSQLEIVKEFRKAVAAQGSSVPDVFALEGYISGQFAVDILKKAAGKYTHEALLKVITGFKEYPFKGFTLTFNPKTREISRKLWLDTGLPEWIEQNMDTGDQ